jgi:glucose-6-phosphate 1-dehydrogenase
MDAPLSNAIVFFGATGALRDVVQNHLLQVLANLMMNAPAGQEHEAVRDQKADLLKAVRPLDAASIVRGQYRGYRSVPGVRPDSAVETFVAVKLFVDSWRWTGVPIYIRAGKGMPVTAAEVLVQFHAPPRDTFGEGVQSSAGYMRVRLSPDVSVGMGVRLLDDAMRGIGELFGRQDIVDAQWRVVDQVLTNPPPCEEYSPGSWGPAAAHALIGADGPWRNPRPSVVG